MQRPCVAAAVLGFLLSGGAANATDWQSGESERGAWASISEGTNDLRISCNRGDPNFYFILSGGPFPGMKNIDDGNESMMMWIEQSDGRTARHPVDGYYFRPERSFVGRFLVSDLILEQFRNGRTMSLSAPTGAGIAEFGMRGTGEARGHFKEACGI